MNVRHKIHPDTRLGPVHLKVSDLVLSIGFYQRSIGLRLHHNGGSQAYLGAGGEDLLVLTEIPGAVRVPRRSGLYHFAILVPSRLALARSLRNLIESETPLQGFADHLVSEAIYLADPDGNGIEIYADRPRSAWEYRNGRLQMDTLPFDAQGVLGELKSDAAPWDGIHADTRLGHIHLHVGDLDAAQAFYTDILGFDYVAGLPSAAFVSAGGYHHHIGLNTWNGVGVPPPPQDAAGLRYFTVVLPNAAELDLIAQRCFDANINYDRTEEGLQVQDPSQNTILFSA